MGRFIGLSHLSAIYVLFMIHWILAKQTLLNSTIFANDHLTNIQFYKGRIYTADQGNIYELNENLETLVRAVTCEDEVAECTSVNKILLVNKATEKMFICGTGNGGICELRNLSSINLVTRISSGENIVKVSGDVNRPAQAVLMADGKLMIGITFGTGLGKTEAKTYNYALSTRSLNEKDVFSASKRLILGIFSGTLEGYLIHFKSGFQQDGFSYFITNQKKFVGGRNYVSKLIRICQNDTSTDYNSYADIELSCNKDGTTYNLIQDAIIIDPPHNMGPATADTLFVATFTAGNNPESVSGDSVICVTRLSDLDKWIMEAKKAFLVCPGSNYTVTQRYLPNNIPNNVACKNESLYDPEYVTCDTVLASLCYVIGEKAYSMAAAYTLPADKGYITKLYGSVVDGDKVDIHAGTSRGNIMKFNFLKMNTPLELYEEKHVPPGFPVRAMHQKDDNYYVMTSGKLLKYKNTDCSEYTACADTMAGRNPLCGLCVYKQRSTRKSECSLDANHWLSSLGQCVSLSLVPEGIPINTGGRQVQVTVRNYPAVQVGDVYKCKYKNGAADILSVDASPDREHFNCSSPNVASHTESTLELWVIKMGVNGIMLATTPFLFYDCGHYKKCGECTSTFGSKCHWCLQNTQCVSPGQCTVSAGASVNITQKDLCPQLLDNRGLHFVPNGVATDVIFKAKHLPTEANAKFFCTVPSITNFQPVEATAKNATSVTFNLTINIAADVRNKSYPAIIKYGTQQNQNANTRVELDDDFSSSVTIYNCEKLATDCGRCKALNTTRYTCDWCGTGVCAYSRSECEQTATCPAPVITKIVPMDGPKQGGTSVTVSGTNLGSKKSDVNNVKLANTICTDIEVVLDHDNQDFERQVTKEIVCKAGEQTSTSAIGIPGDVIVTVAGKQSSASSNVKYTYQTITITGMYPTSGPKAGGTSVTIVGEHLGVGNREVDVYFGNALITNAEVLPKLGFDAKLESVNFTVQFVVPSGLFSNIIRVSLLVHGRFVAIGKLSYSLLPNPVIYPISPKKAIKSGGTRFTITGSRLTNANAVTVTVEYAGLTTTSVCAIKSESTAVCPSPKAPTNLYIGSYGNIKRKRRSVGCGCVCECVKTTITIALDGIKASFTLTYYKDPTLNTIGDELLFESADQRLTIEGTNLNFAATKDDINVTVGIKTCTVIELTETRLTCLAPKDQPESGMGKTLPEVNVTISNIHETLGYLKYKQLEELVTNLTIIIVVVVAVVLVLVVAGTVVGCLMYRRMGSKFKEFEQKATEKDMKLTSIESRLKESEAKNQELIKESGDMEDPYACIEDIQIHDTYNEIGVAEKDDTQNTYLDLDAATRGSGYLQTNEIERDSGYLHPLFNSRNSDDGQLEEESLNSGYLNMEGNTRKSGNEQPVHGRPTNLGNVQPQEKSRNSGYEEPDAKLIVKTKNVGSEQPHDPSRNSGYEKPIHGQTNLENVKPQDQSRNSSYEEPDAKQKVKMRSTGSELPQDPSGNSDYENPDAPHADSSAGVNT